MPAELQIITRRMIADYVAGNLSAEDTDTVEEAICADPKCAMAVTTARCVRKRLTSGQSKPRPKNHERCADFAR